MHMLTYADGMDLYAQRHDSEAVTCDDFSTFKYADVCWRMLTYADVC